MEIYVGTVMLVGFNFQPPGWLFCDGRLLQISQYEVLYNLIGTTYGGDGQNTFGIPDLRGRVPIGMGQGKGGGNYAIGQNGGAEQVLLGVPNYPAHTHVFQATSNPGATGAPANAALASGQNLFVQNPNLTAPLDASACTLSPGGATPHNNLQPYLTLNWMIATQGVYPSQS